MDLCRQLQYLVGAEVLQSGAQKTGERLLNRLVADIRVVLLGPEAASKNYLQEVLIAQALPQTTVSVADLNHGFHFEDADVCIWCTSGFGVDEAQQWREAPDRLKDHSFLVPLVASEIGQVDMDALEDIAAEEFYGLFPIVIGPQVIEAPKDAARELLREVANLVQLGLAADADNARMFLKNHPCPKAPEYPNTTKPPWPTSAPSPAKVCLPNEPTAVTRVYQKAQGTLRDNVARLAPFTSARADADFLQILAICQETSAEIADVFSENQLDDPEFCMIKGEVLSAADKILLMSLEGGVAPAITATTTILQIQRELEAQIAN